MTTTRLDETMEQTRMTIEGGPSERFLERLADTVGAKATVKAVFGDPIERDGLTVIPVARVRWGVGGGAGLVPEGAPGPGSGSGGGGGAIADPVGYLEIASGDVTFRAIAPGYPSPALLLAAGVSAALIVRAVARLIRG